LKKNHFNVRIQLSEYTLPDLDTFFNSIEYFSNLHKNIVLEFFLWHDIKDKVKIEEILNMCKKRNITLHDKPLLNIHFFADISIKNYNNPCRFKIYYDDSNSFINSVFQFYNLIKSSLEKDENRNYRKQIFHSKAKDTGSIVEDKKGTSRN